MLPRAGLSATASVAVSNGDDDVPELLDSDLPTLQAALDAADVLLEVVDARDILGGRSLKVEELVTDAGSKVLLVVNKIGGCWLDRPKHSTDTRRPRPP